MSEKTTFKTVILVILFAICMGYFESSIVVYLRGLFYPEGFVFPLQKMPENLVMIEIGREFISILMILVVALLSTKNRWQRFANFFLIFAIWDIIYYLCLKLFLGWPTSLFTWDILFLIPVPWASPVLAPLMVSGIMLLAWLIIWIKKSTLVKYKFPIMFWIMEALGVIAMLISFMENYRIIINFDSPQSFNWPAFIGGWILTVGTFIFYISSKRLLKIKPLETGS